MGFVEAIVVHAILAGVVVAAVRVSYWIGLCRGRAEAGVQVCTREPWHDGPCNGLPCPTMKLRMEGSRPRPMDLCECGHPHEDHPDVRCVQCACEEFEHG